MILMSTIQCTKYSYKSFLNEGQIGFNSIEVYIKASTHVKSSPKAKKKNWNIKFKASAYWKKEHTTAKAPFISNGYGFRDVPCHTYAWKMKTVTEIQMISFIIANRETSFSWNSIVVFVVVDADTVTNLLIHIRIIIVFDILPYLIWHLKYASLANKSFNLCHNSVNMRTIPSIRCYSIMHYLTIFKQKKIYI